jgi:tetratricopeptide (TPR) repeat protein
VIGKTFSHYRIIAKLGGGGMGVVYKAHDQKLDRTIALKFLPHHMSHTDAQRDRFVREARAASALDHPNICTIYEIDETDDGQTFIAMGYCEGEPLDEVIARGALPIEEAVRIATKVASGLVSAHLKNIVHRDIKPANIIVNCAGNVKIIDFGLAKLAGQTAVTREGTMLGTVGYMSPEQAQGLDVDHRTDIWALGLVLYEMIAGTHPFAADHEAAVLYRIVNDEPTPLATHCRDAPPTLEEIILRALAKNPDDRYETMDEMASSLNTSCDESNAAATVDLSPMLTRARAALERYDWPEAFAIFTEASSRSELDPEDLERWADAASWMSRVDVCIEAREDAHAQYLKAGRSSDAARAAIELADDNYATGARSVCNGWLQRAEKLLEKAPDAVENGYLARLKAKIAIEADQDLNAALKHTEKALKSAEMHADSDLRALAIQDRGRVLVLKNQVNEGMGLLDEAMAAALSGELSPLVIGTTYCNMISMCARIADYRRAGEWSDSAVRWCKPYSESGFSGICSVRRAEVMRIRGDWVAAEGEARRASMRDEGYGAKVAAEAFYAMGEIKFRRGEFEAAEELFQEAHGRGRHPVPGMALLRAAQGQHEASRSLIDRALSAEAIELDRVLLLPAGVEIALLAGDVARARMYADELVSLVAGLGSNVFSGHAAHATGTVALAEGNVEEALSSLGDACRCWQEADTPYEEARTRLLLATAYWGEGEADLAELEAFAARTIFERLGAIPDLERTRALITENS